jgi:alkaline phosphatase D
MAKVQRRQFLSWMGMSVAGAWGWKARGQGIDRSPEWFFAEENPKSGLSILQGFTNAHSTQLTVVAPREASLLFAVRPSKLGASSVTARSEIVERSFSQTVVHRVWLNGLELGVDYTLSIYGPNGQKFDERVFRALDLSPRPVRLAFVSCALDFLHRNDMALFLGYNVYADRLSLTKKVPADPEQLWNRYVETRQSVAFYYWPRLVPVLATWDDHDFGADNSGAGYAYKDESKVVFETFFAQTAGAESEEIHSGPGIARKVTAFGADLFFMDDRFFRGEPGTPSSRMWGEEQVRWLEQSLSERPAWLLNGSLFFGGYTEKDAFEGMYDYEFRPLLDTLQKHSGLVCFASGDVHFSELMRIEKQILGYETFELVSSSIHSFTFPGHQNRFTNPRRLAATGRHNFVMFEGSFTSGLIQGRVRCQSVAGLEYDLPVSVHR